MLHFRAGELKPNQSSTFGVKFSRRSQYIGAVFPLLLAATHDNRSGRHQFLHFLRWTQERSVAEFTIALEAERKCFIVARKSRGDKNTRCNLNDGERYFALPVAYRSAFCIMRPSTIRQIPSGFASCSSTGRALSGNA